MEERRKHRRIPLSLDVYCERMPGSYEARLNNINAGGCFIETDERAAKGAILDFAIHLPTGRWLQLQGEVTYEHPPVGLGLRFTELSSEEQELLALVIEFTAGDGS